MGMLSPEFRPPNSVPITQLCVNWWQRATGLDKPELAEASTLWNVYMNKYGCRRNQTLDRYLDINTLPGRPRWLQVTRTAEFVLESCELESSEKDQLEAMLLKFHLL